MFAFEVVDSGFDLPLSVSCGQTFRWKNVSDNLWTGVDGNNWFEVNVVPNAVHVTSNAPRDAFERLFRLDHDHVAELEQILMLGPELKPYIDQLRGLRVLRPTDPTETLFSFICSANNNLSRITKMVVYLGSLGNALGRGLHAFPHPNQIASIPVKTLQDQGFGYRATSIVGTAKMLCMFGDKWLTNLKSGSYEEGRLQLQKLPGVGPKVADCVCLYGFHQYEAVPVDTHLYQAAVRLYFPEWSGMNSSNKRINEVGQFLRNRFGRIAGIAHQYLFFENLLRNRSKWPQV